VGAMCAHDAPGTNTATLTREGAARQSARGALADHAAHTHPSRACAGRWRSRVRHAGQLRGRARRLPATRGGAGVST
jgi:hypothetical protein